uniref:Uncharacterized protein n=1 Tax=Arundo donax TaxID=35708 RepID=A0A0A9GB78_ARUDO
MRPLPFGSASHLFQSRQRRVGSAGRRCARRVAA